MDEPVAVHGDHPAGRLKRVEQTPQLRRPEGHAPGEGPEPDARGAHVTDVLLQHRLRVARLQQREMGHQGRPLALEARRIDVEQRAAADRHDRRVGADDEPVAGPRDQRPLETKPREARLTGRELGPVQQQRAGHDLARSDVEPHPRARPEGAWRILQELKRSVYKVRGHERAGQSVYVTAGDRGPLETLQVDRGALSRSGRGHRMAVGLQPPNLGLGLSRIDLDTVVDTERARGERAGDDGAESLDGEDPVDGEPRKLVGLALGHRLREGAKRGAEVVEPLARLGGYRENRRARQKRVADRARHVLPYQLEPDRPW